MSSDGPSRGKPDSQDATTAEKVRRFLTEDATIRVSAVIATRLVEEMRTTLSTYPIASVALGRTLIGSILMSSHLKEGHSVGIYIRGNGPLGTLFAESSYEGQARAYTANPKLEMPSVDGRLNISRAVGHGLLEVVRGVPHEKQPHSGTVIIKTGEIGDDLAFYLDQSHQIPSVVALGVQVDEYGRIVAAGGVLIELMPGASEDAIGQIEARAQQIKSLSKMIADGADELDLVKAFLGDLKLVELAHKHSLRYECRCSIDRVKRSLILIGHQELDQMIAENRPAEVQCEFCGRQYSLEVSELTQLRHESFRKSLH